MSIPSPQRSWYNQMYQSWKILFGCDFLLLEWIQNKQEQIFPALRRWSLELNKYYFNLDALGWQASIIKLIQISEIAIGQKQEQSHILFSFFSVWPLPLFSFLVRWLCLPNQHYFIAFVHGVSLTGSTLPFRICSNAVTSSWCSWYCTSSRKPSQLLYSSFPQLVFIKRVPAILLGTRDTKMKDIYSQISRTFYFFIQVYCWSDWILDMIICVRPRLYWLYFSIVIVCM